MPENYNPENPTKYPVVFVLDGGVHFNAVSTVHQYYSGGYIPEMIIVGISNRNNRTRDLTTSKISVRRGRAYDQETGCADKFMQFIEKELIPYIENKYPVTDYRTLIGHSYAGLFTINALMNYPDLFENYLAIDPSLDWDNQKLLNQSREILKKNTFQDKSLFISLGGQLHMQDYGVTIDNVMQDTSEYTLLARSNIGFSQLAEKHDQNELNVRWKYYESDIHGTVPLPSILDGLIYFFNWYPIEGTNKFNSPETPLNELVKLIKDREVKLAKHFGYTVPPFEEGLFIMLGYMNMDMGQLEKSHAFFQMAIEYFPESANAYDSIADYYKAQNDNVNALKYVTKAYEISPDTRYENRIEQLKKKK
ncbi:MAG: putative alpha/beta superfamily hydrolase [Halioglobus sp.]